MKKIRKTKTVILLILIILSANILSGCIGKEKEVKTSEEKATKSEGTGGPNWCIAGTKITSTTSQGQGSFEIKGITTYKGKDVCEAVYDYGGGSAIQYSTEDGKYMAIVYKDTSGNVINEVESVNP